MGQNIPLGPLDRTHAVRRHWRRRLRRQVPAGLDPSLLLAAVGMALAGVGLWLTGAPPPVAVSMDAAAYTVGGARLEARSAGVYESSEGALVVRAQPGETRAAASATFNGAPMTGVCSWAGGAREERCVFKMGDRTLEAVDRRTASGWHRRYQDGREVDVQVRGGGPVPVPVPVPFPVGA
jgi:hypothetical protein